jgi:hypothetical protein
VCAGPVQAAYEASEPSTPPDRPAPSQHAGADGCHQRDVTMEYIPLDAGSTVRMPSDRHFAPFNVWDWTRQLQVLLGRRGAYSLLAHGCCDAPICPGSCAEAKAGPGRSGLALPPWWAWSTWIARSI